MKKWILFSFSFIAFAPTFAQKKLVLVSQSALTGISLPAGSKQDSRMLSVSAAQMMLEMESKKSAINLSAVEVLVLPSVASYSFDEDSLAGQLTAQGWLITPVEGDKNYAWLQKGSNSIIRYFSMDKKETSLYFAKASAIPNMKQPVNNAPASQAINTENSQPQQPANSPVQNNIGETDNKSFIYGTWGTSTSNQSSYRVNNGLMNYIKRQYTFNANGTYRFITKTFDPFMNKILLGKENGSFQINGNTITINPEKSVLEGWSKKDGTDKWGKLLDSQNIELEKVTYQFTKYYFTGIQEWSLVLQADKVTNRDGPFGGNTSFANAWYYGTPCNQCLIELPK